MPLPAAGFCPLAWPLELEPAPWDVPDEELDWEPALELDVEPCLPCVDELPFEEDGDDGMDGDEGEPDEGEGIDGDGICGEGGVGTEGGEDLEAQPPIARAVPSRRPMPALRT